MKYFCSDEASKSCPCQNGQENWVSTYEILATDPLLLWNLCDIWQNVPIGMNDILGNVSIGFWLLVSMGQINIVLEGEKNNKCFYPVLQSAVFCILNLHRMEPARLSAIVLFRTQFQNVL